MTGKRKANRWLAFLLSLVLVAGSVMPTSAASLNPGIGNETDAVETQESQDTSDAVSAQGAEADADTGDKSPGTASDASADTGDKAAAGGADADAPEEEGVFESGAVSETDGDDPEAAGEESFESLSFASNGAYSNTYYLQFVGASKDKIDASKSDQITAASASGKSYNYKFESNNSGETAFDELKAALSAITSDIPYVITYQYWNASAYADLTSGTNFTTANASEDYPVTVSIADPTVTITYANAGDTPTEPTTVLYETTSVTVSAKLNTVALDDAAYSAKGYAWKWELVGAGSGINAMAAFDGAANDGTKTTTGAETATIVTKNTGSIGVKATLVKASNGEAINFVNGSSTSAVSGAAEHDLTITPFVITVTRAANGNLAKTRIALPTAEATLTNGKVAPVAGVGNEDKFTYTVDDINDMKATIADLNNAIGNTPANGVYDYTLTADSKDITSHKADLSDLADATQTYITTNSEYFANGKIPAAWKTISVKPRAKTLGSSVALSDNTIGQTNEDHDTLVDYKDVRVPVYAGAIADKGEFTLTVTPAAGKSLLDTLPTADGFAAESAADKSTGLAWVWEYVQINQGETKAAAADIAVSTMYSTAKVALQTKDTTPSSNYKPLAAGNAKLFDKLSASSDGASTVYISPQTSGQILLKAQLYSQIGDAKATPADEITVSNYGDSSKSVAVSAPQYFLLTIGEDESAIGAFRIYEADGEGKETAVYNDPTGATKTPATLEINLVDDGNGKVNNVANENWTKTVYVALQKQEDGAWATQTTGAKPTVTVTTSEPGVVVNQATAAVGGASHTGTVTPGASTGIATLHLTGKPGTTAKRTATITVSAAGYKTATFNVHVTQKYNVSVGLTSASGSYAELKADHAAATEYNPITVDAGADLYTAVLPVLKKESDNWFALKTGVAGYEISGYYTAAGKTANTQITSEDKKPVTAKNMTVYADFARIQNPAIESVTATIGESTKAISLTNNASETLSLTHVGASGTEKGNKDNVLTLNVKVSGFATGEKIDVAVNGSTTPSAFTITNNTTGEANAAVDGTIVLTTKTIASTGVYSVQLKQSSNVLWSFQIKVDRKFMITPKAPAAGAAFAEGKSASDAIAVSDSATYAEVDEALRALNLFTAAEGYVLAWDETDGTDKYDASQGYWQFSTTKFGGEKTDNAATVFTADVEVTPIVEHKVSVKFTLEPTFKNSLISLTPTSPALSVPAAQEFKWVTAGSSSYKPTLNGWNNAWEATSGAYRLVYAKTKEGTTSYTGEDVVVYDTLPAVNKNTEFEIRVQVRVVMKDAAGALTKGLSNVAKTKGTDPSVSGIEKISSSYYAWVSYGSRMTEDQLFTEEKTDGEFAGWYYIDADGYPVQVTSGTVIDKDFVGKAALAPTLTGHWNLTLSFADRTGSALDIDETDTAAILKNAEVNTVKVLDSVKWDATSWVYLYDRITSVVNPVAKKTSGDTTTTYALTMFDAATSGNALTAGAAASGSFGTAGVTENKTIYVNYALSASAKDYSTYTIEAVSKSVPTFTWQSMGTVPAQNKNVQFKVMTGTGANAEPASGVSLTITNSNTAELTAAASATTDANGIASVSLSTKHDGDTPAQNGNWGPTEMPVITAKLAGSTVSGSVEIPMTRKYAVKFPKTIKDTGLAFAATPTVGDIDLTSDGDEGYYYLIEERDTSEPIRPILKKIETYATTSLLTLTDTYAGKVVDKVSISAASSYETSNGAVYALAANTTAADLYGSEYMGGDLTIGFTFRDPDEEITYDYSPALKVKTTNNGLKIIRHEEGEIAELFKNVKLPSDLTNAEDYTIYKGTPIELPTAEELGAPEGWDVVYYTWTDTNGNDILDHVSISEDVMTVWDGTTDPVGTVFVSFVTDVRLYSNPNVTVSAGAMTGTHYDMIPVEYGTPITWQLGPNDTESAGKHALALDTEPTLSTPAGTGLSSAVWFPVDVEIDRDKSLIYFDPADTEWNKNTSVVTETGLSLYQNWYVKLTLAGKTAYGDADDLIPDGTTALNNEIGNTGYGNADVEDMDEFSGKSGKLAPVKVFVGDSLFSGKYPLQAVDTYFKTPADTESGDYELVGWSTTSPDTTLPATGVTLTKDADGNITTWTGRVTAATSTVVTAPIKLYAIYEKKALTYQVSIDPGEGTISAAGFAGTTDPTGKTLKAKINGGTSLFNDGGSYVFDELDDWITPPEGKVLKYFEVVNDVQDKNGKTVHAAKDYFNGSEVRAANGSDITNVTRNVLAGNVSLKAVYDVEYYTMRLTLGDTGASFKNVKLNTVKDDGGNDIEFNYQPTASEPYLEFKVYVNATPGDNVYNTIIKLDPMTSKNTAVLIDPDPAETGITGVTDAFTFSKLTFSTLDGEGKKQDTTLDASTDLSTLTIDPDGMVNGKVLVTPVYTRDTMTVQIAPGEGLSWDTTGPINDGVNNWTFFGSATKNSDGGYDGVYYRTVTPSPVGPTGHQSQGLALSTTTNGLVAFKNHMTKGSLEAKAPIEWKFGGRVIKNAANTYNYSSTNNEFYLYTTDADESGHFVVTATTQEKPYAVTWDLGDLFSAGNLSKASLLTVEGSSVFATGNDIYTNRSNPTYFPISVNKGEKLAKPGITSVGAWTPTWYAVTNGVLATTPFDFSTALTSDVNLKAVWTTNVKVDGTNLTNAKIGGSTDYATNGQTVKLGDTIQLVKTQSQTGGLVTLPADKLTGSDEDFKFNGWTLTTGLTSTTKASSVTTYAANLTNIGQDPLVVRPEFNVLAVISLPEGASWADGTANDKLGTTARTSTDTTTRTAIVAMGKSYDTDVTTRASLDAKLAKVKVPNGMTANGFENGNIAAPGQALTVHVANTASMLTVNVKYSAKNAAAKAAIKVKYGADFFDLTPAKDYEIGKDLENNLQALYTALSALSLEGVDQYGIMNYSWSKGGVKTTMKKADFASGSSVALTGANGIASGSDTQGYNLTINCEFGVANLEVSVYPGLKQSANDETRAGAWKAAALGADGWTGFKDAVVPTGTDNAKKRVNVAKFYVEATNAGGTDLLKATVSAEQIEKILGMTETWSLGQYLDTSLVYVGSAYNNKKEVSTASAIELTEGKATIFAKYDAPVVAISIFNSDGDMIAANTINPAGVKIDAANTLNVVPNAKLTSVKEATGNYSIEVASGDYISYTVDVTPAAAKSAILTTPSVETVDGVANRYGFDIRSDGRIYASENLDRKTTLTFTNKYAINVNYDLTAPNNIYEKGDNVVGTYAAIAIGGGTHGKYTYTIGGTVAANDTYTIGSYTFTATTANASDVAAGLKTLMDTDPFNKKYTVTNNADTVVIEEKDGYIGETPPDCSRVSVAGTINRVETTASVVSKFHNALNDTQKAEAAANNRFGAKGILTVVLSDYYNEKGKLALSKLSDIVFAPISESPSNGLTVFGPDDGYVYRWAESAGAGSNAAKSVSLSKYLNSAATIDVDIDVYQNGSYVSTITQPVGFVTVGYELVANNDQVGRDYITDSYATAIANADGTQYANHKTDPYGDLEFKLTPVFEGPDVCVAVVKGEPRYNPIVLANSIAGKTWDITASKVNKLDYVNVMKPFGDNTITVSLNTRNRVSFNKRTPITIQAAYNQKQFVTKTTIYATKSVAPLTLTKLQVQSVSAADAVNMAPVAAADKILGYDGTTYTYTNLLGSFGTAAEGIAAKQKFFTLTGKIAGGVDQKTNKLNGKDPTIKVASDNSGVAKLSGKVEFSPSTVDPADLQFTAVIAVGKAGQAILTFTNNDDTQSNMKLVVNVLSPDLTPNVKELSFNSNMNEAGRTRNVVLSTGAGLAGVNISDVDVETVGGSVEGKTVTPGVDPLVSFRMNYQKAGTISFVPKTFTYQNQELDGRKYFNPVKLNVKYSNKLPNTKISSYYKANLAIRQPEAVFTLTSDTRIESIEVVKGSLVVSKPGSVALTNEDVLLDVDADSRRNLAYNAASSQYVGNIWANTSYFLGMQFTNDDLAKLALVKPAEMPSKLNLKIKYANIETPVEITVPVTYQTVNPTITPSVKSVTFYPAADITQSRVSLAYQVKSVNHAMGGNKMLKLSDAVAKKKLTVYEIENEDGRDAIPINGNFWIGVPNDSANMAIMTSAKSESVGNALVYSDDVYRSVNVPMSIGYNTVLSKLAITKPAVVPLNINAPNDYKETELLLGGSIPLSCTNLTPDELNKALTPDKKTVDAGIDKAVSVAFDNWHQLNIQWSDDFKDGKYTNLKPGTYTWSLELPANESLKGKSVSKTTISVNVVTKTALAEAITFTKTGTLDVYDRGGNGGAAIIDYSKGLKVTPKFVSTNGEITNAEFADQSLNENFLLDVDDGNVYIQIRDDAKDLRLKKKYNFALNFTVTYDNNDTQLVSVNDLYLGAKITGKAQKAITAVNLTQAKTNFSFYTDLLTRKKVTGGTIEGVNNHALNAISVNIKSLKAGKKDTAANDDAVVAVNNIDGAAPKSNRASTAVFDDTQFAVTAFEGADAATYTLDTDGNNITITQQKQLPKGKYRIRFYLYPENCANNTDATVLTYDITVK